LKVILDSNTIIADFAMSSPSFIIILSSSRKGEIELIIPEIVIDEVLNKHRQRLEKSAADIKTEIGKFNKLGNTNFTNPLSPEIVKETCEAYELRLQEIIENNKIVVLSYPETPHKFLARKAMQIKKPFQANEKGYRDCLIWENVKSLISNADSEIILSPQVCFVTANHKDFLDEYGKIHVDLANELDDQEFRRDAISIYENLHIFNETFTKLNLEHAQLVEGRLRDKEFWEVKLKTQLDDLLAEVLIGDQFGNWSSDYSDVDDGPIIEEISEIEYKYEKLLVKELVGTEYVVDVKAHLHLGIEVFIDKHDYYSSRNKDYKLIDSDWNDHVVRAWQNVEVPVVLTIVINGNFECIALEINDFSE